MTLHKPAPTLELMQQRFAEALLDVGLLEQVRPLFAIPISPLEARLAYYRGNQSSILISALSSAYPVLRQLTGVEFFEQMAKNYGRTYPSQLGDLNHFGAGLSRYLAGLSISTDYPYFVDVATLEWKVHRAYYAADASHLTLPSMLLGAGEKVQSVRLSLHPATQLHESNNASVLVWLAHQDSDDSSAQFELSQPGYGLVTRHDWQAGVTCLSEPAFLALQALTQQRTLGDALDVALSVDAKFDIASALNAWFSVGAFSHFYFCKE